MSDIDAKWIELARKELGYGDSVPDEQMDRVRSRAEFLRLADSLTLTEAAERYRETSAKRDEAAAQVARLDAEIERLQSDLDAARTVIRNADEENWRAHALLARVAARPPR